MPDGAGRRRRVRRRGCSRRPRSSPRPRRATAPWASGSTSHHLMWSLVRATSIGVPRARAVARHREDRERLAAVEHALHARSHPPCGIAAGPDDEGRRPCGTVATTCGSATVPRPPREGRRRAPVPRGPPRPSMPRARHRRIAATKGPERALARWSRFGATCAGARLASMARRADEGRGGRPCGLAHRVRGVRAAELLGALPQAERGHEQRDRAREAEGRRYERSKTRDAPPLPLQRALEVPELLLTFLELRRVQVDAPEAAAARDHVMEHLVVDDVGDEVAGDPLLIERRVDADQPVDGAVASELDRPLRGSLGLPRRALAPRDDGVDAAVEVALVDPVEELEQIVVLALGDEGRVALAAREPEAVVVDVVAERRARVAVAASDVADERVDHGGGRVEEHVVHARVKDALLDAVRNDRVPVVRDRQDDRARKAPPGAFARAPAEPPRERTAGATQRGRPAELSPHPLRNPDGCRHLRTSQDKAAAGRHTGRACRDLRTVGAPRSDRPSVFSTPRVRGWGGGCQGCDTFVISSNDLRDEGPRPHAAALVGPN